MAEDAVDLGCDAWQGGVRQGKLISQASPGFGDRIGGLFFFIFVGAKRV